MKLQELLIKCEHKDNDETICMIDVAGGNAVYYYHFDGLGSVAALSDIIGDTVERYSYSAFGEPNRVSGVGNPYMFTGRNYDWETGLYYYRARYYKPSIGRFMQVDPVDYKDSMNLYTYVLNNPINHIDPKGTFIEFDPICIWQVAKAVRDTKGKNDKYRHCYVGCKISAYCGIEWCVSAGALKELLDKLGLGTPEWKDFVATMDGCTSGLNPFKSCACGCKDKGYSP
jgi:RHS repeat-associated protein